MSNTNVAWMNTMGYLTIVHEGKPICLKSGTDKYASAMKLINNNDEKGLVDFLFPAKQIASFSKNDFVVDGKTVVDSKSGVQLPTAIAQRLIEFAYSGYPYRALKNFWENLKKNPSQHSREQLFNFLEHNKVPILEDGTFLGYKKVVTSKGKLVDTQTRSIDNSIGKVVSMDRKKVDADPSVSCSTGLHVAAWEYAQGYGGDTLVEVKVNPKDVVSVPNDYNFQKMRVCRYVVMAKGDKQVEKSYLSKKYIAGKTQVINANNIDTLSAREIITFVKKATGQIINLSVKSKQAIVRKAREFLGINGASSTQDEIDISQMSANEIIEIVREQTGEIIRLSPKSKQSIVRSAKRILEEHGLNVKV